MGCEIKDLYKSVKKCPGERIAPGIRPYVYFTQKANILTWPKLPVDVTTDMSELVTLDGDFTLGADAKWHKIDLVDLKSSATSETQGEYPNATQLNHAELVVGGTGAEISGFTSVAINDSLVYLVPERDGKFRLYGNESFDVKTTVSQASGAGVTDAKQSTVTIEVPDYCPPPFYTGKIETADDGDISGADGSAVTEPGP